MIRIGVHMIFKDAMYEQFKAIMKKIVGEGVSEKALADTALAVEVNAIGLMNIFLLRKCFYSFFLEFLAD
jgi:hypothetical protein